MKILLSSFACEPELGSEEGIGWNTVVETAKFNEVWVLTRGFCRQTIEPYLAIHPIPNLHFIYFEPLGWSEDWKGRQGFLTLHYYLWQIWAYFVGKKLHQKIKFDLARHVNYVRFWNPSFIALLPIPFVWGPVGGGESSPGAFWSDFSLRGKIYELVRDLARGIGEMDPFVGITAKRSKIAIAATQESATKINQYHPQQIKVISCVGLTSQEIDTLAQLPPPPVTPIRFLSVGRLLHWKGLHLALKGFALAKLEKAEYWIIGKGAEMTRLESLAQTLGLGDKVKFWGALPRQETLTKMGECHVLLHPSLHDSGGFVCAEMMAASRPVICLNLGGPAVQVTPETGILIEAKNPQQVVEDLGRAIAFLANDRQQRDRLGQAAQKRIQTEYNWEIRGRLFQEIYQEVTTVA